MDGLFSCKPLPGFGPNHVDPFADPAALKYVSASRPAALRARVRELCPRKPGVYGMIGDKDELLYVGKAKSLRARLLSYFRTKSRDPKAGRIVGHAHTIVWEYASSEFAALLRELELIRRWRPRFNVQGQPNRRRPIYVCLGRKPAPHLFLTRQPPRGVVACFGPVPAAWRARDAVRRLNDWFGLRDCPHAQEMVFADQAELFPAERAAGCLRYEIGTCLGPCVAACTRQAYTKRVRLAQAFLAGTDLSVLTVLEGKMAAASAALDFEQAASLRDRLASFRWVREQLDHLRLARTRPAFVYPVATADGHKVWYLVQAGRVAAAFPAPRTAEEKQAAAQLLRKATGRKQASIPVPADEIDGVLLVAAWFRRHAAEQAHCLDPARAIELCETAGG